MTKPTLGPRAPWPAVMMQIALAAGTRSKDATTRVGAVVCDSSWRVLGTGYNGTPRGTAGDRLHMTGKPRHLWAVHAEENSLLFAVAAAGQVLLHGTMFCTHAPCARCVRLAAHCGIYDIVWLLDERDPEQRAEADALAHALKIGVTRLDAASRESLPAPWHSQDLLR